MSSHSGLRRRLVLGGGATLLSAPLVADPDAVLLPAAVRSQLQALQQRVPVGIVTGRALADLRPRLAFVPDYLIGNHGLEGVPAGAADA